LLTQQPFWVFFAEYDQKLPGREKGDNWKVEKRINREEKIKKKRNVRQRWKRFLPGQNYIVVKYGFVKDNEHRRHNAI